MLKKVKNWLGIEGVQVEFNQIPEKDEFNNVVKGSVNLVSKSDQHIRDIHITIKEQYTRGRRKSKLTDEFVIGNVIIPINFDMSSGVSKEIEFEVAYALLKSEIESWGDKNIVYKGISKTAKFLKNAKSKFYVLAEVDVVGNRLKPYVRQEINL